MIAIGSDHAGYELKKKICSYLEQRGIEYKDFGVYVDKSADYAPIAVTVSQCVLSGAYRLGILCCGTGVGMSIAANKIKGIRAACCSEPFSAEMTRRHNDANLLCLGGRVVRDEDIPAIVGVFLDSPYEGGRHARRVDQISKIENGEYDFSDGPCGGKTHE